MCCVVSIARNGLRLKNPRKATGPDFIPLKVIKFASDVIDSHLYNIVTYLKKQVLRRDKNSIGKTHFQEKWKNKVGNYKPVSILNGMLKIYERRIHNSLSSYAKTILSNFILAYRKPYSSNHVLLRPVENCKKSSIMDTLLLDLSMTFDCIPHELLAAKLHAYGLFRGCNNVCAFTLKT